MWFVVLILKHWDSIEGTMMGLTAKVAADPDDPCVGFLAVYSTREAALEAAEGDATLVRAIQQTAPAEVAARLAEGWGGPLLASKFHYFVNGRSLCRRWAFTGELQAGEVGEARRTEDCVACYRKLEKRRAAKAKEAKA